MSSKLNNSNKFNILVVEDEANICSFIEALLSTNGYRPLVAHTCAMGLTLFASRAPDLVILDLGLPDRDGLDFIRAVRQRYRTPIIVLSARTTERDKISALDLGANDYVTKPFNILELKARIRALLRRAGQTAQKRTELLTAGGIALDTERRIALRDGVPVDLTAKEYDILELLIKNPHRVYSRENLMDLVWGYTYAGDYRTVDVHIRRLREKLEHDPAEPEHIMTKWGVGYYLKD